MPPVTTAIILAGGLGTRLRSVVADRPKPMAEIAGRPFLEYLLDYWIGQGIRRFIVSTGYRAEMISGHFGSRYRAAAIDYAVEETPLGTGGGLLLAAERVDDPAPFLLLNGDTFFAVDLGELSAFHHDRHSDWTFSLFRTRETSRYMGMDAEMDGRVASLKKIAGSQEVLANGGVYLLSRAALAAWPAAPRMPVSLENDLLPALLAAGGRLYGLESAAPFIDIGIPDDYRRAADILVK